MEESWETTKGSQHRSPEDNDTTPMGTSTARALHLSLQNSPDRASVCLPDSGSVPSLPASGLTSLSDVMELQAPEAGVLVLVHTCCAPATRPLGAARSPGWAARSRMEDLGRRG